MRIPTSLSTLSPILSARQDPQNHLSSYRFFSLVTSEIFRQHTINATPPFLQPNHDTRNLRNGQLHA